MAIFNKSGSNQPTSDESFSPPELSQKTASTSNTSAPAQMTDNSVSTIAQDMKITGDVTCGGVIRVEGQVEGSISGARQVLIGRQGMVKGDVNAKEAVIGGKVEGSVTATERIEIQGTALINGDIMAKSMLVQEGGRINGAIRMEEAGSARGREGQSGQTGPVAVVR